MARDEDKRLAALAAAAEVLPGMVVGLGTGSTAAWLIYHLAERVRDGLSITAVVTSHATERAARGAGIAILAFDDLAAIDLAIDGVDEIDDQLWAIKGAGGAMLREKIVATAARRMIAIADGSKRCAAIGRASVPVEILPFARTFALDRLKALGAIPTLRMANDRPFVTDQDNLVIDCSFSALPDPAAMATQLAAIPGVLGHGLFLSEIDTAYIAENGQVVRMLRP
ncbi:ribose-5-phosphate isomerase RpiA [Sphingomonas sp. ERG5]|uniref:ribose-5-phosphate isomerase RpiA n=1 Tax=Sphingomonas sp. ERG5 TaxID=1381597 RepID=UPI00054C46ED|nr:ribose-5-phosphate isomerase RpiA [Sphingomonas sp. ERG5]